MHDILVRLRRHHRAPNLDECDDDDDKSDALDSDTASLELERTQMALSSYIASVLPSILRTYAKHVSSALRGVSWPKMGEHKALDLSSPAKWADLEDLCCDLLAVEYFVQHLARERLFPEISEAVPHPTGHCSWTMAAFLEPIRKRFCFNFSQRRASNRLNRMEWTLDFVAAAIGHNLAVLREVLEPLLLENGLDVDVERAFIGGLIAMLRPKVKSTVAVLVRLLEGGAEESKVALLLAHTIDEMLRFQCDLIDAHPWTASAPACNIMREVLDEAVLCGAWLALEKQRINGECVLINGTRDVRWLFALHQADFMDASAAHYVSNAAQHIVELLHTRSARIACIVDLRRRLRFAEALLLQTLWLCAEYFADEFAKHLHYARGMDAHSTTMCCGIVVSSDYVAQCLRQWDAQADFVALARCRRMVPTNTILTRQGVLDMALDEEQEQAPSFFAEVIGKLGDVQQRQLMALADCVCHQVRMECGRYLNETFGFLHYVETERAESEHEDAQQQAMQAEFSDVFATAADALRWSRRSLPAPLFAQLSGQVSEQMDAKLLDKVLEMKYSFFRAASCKMRFDFECLFSLFFAHERELDDARRVSVVERARLRDRFPMMCALLRVVCMDAQSALQMADALDAARGRGLNKVAQVMEGFSVHALDIEQVDRIIAKMSGVKKKRTAGANPTDDADDDESDFSDFSDDFPRV